MKKILTTTLAFALALFAGIAFQPQHEVYAQTKKIYELRTYTTAPGRLPALLNRFGGGEVDLFIKHGMSSVGYWIPDDEQLSQNTMVYMVAHENREAAAASWAAFGSDPAWHTMRDKSREDGPIVINVVTQFLNPTSFSPMQ